MPGSPQTRVNPGPQVPEAALRHSRRCASSSSRPTNVELKLRSSAPVRASGAVASQASRGWLFPLTATGWQASKAKTFSVG